MSAEGAASAACSEVHLDSEASEASPSASERHFDVLLFDLDGTLYSADCGYVAHTRDNMFRYIQDKGWVPEGQSPEEYWRPLFQKYNQSLRGWKAMGHITTEEECDEYWAYCRKGTADFMPRDDELRFFLECIPKSTRKYIFTNANEKEAKEALECLGIADQFLEVYGSKFMGDVCKPEALAFHAVLQHLQDPDPDSSGATGIDLKRVCMFEDSYKNLRTANLLGMGTVFIESKLTAAEEGVSESDRRILSAQVSSLSDESGNNRLRKQLPGLFRG